MVAGGSGNSHGNAVPASRDGNDEGRSPVEFIQFNNGGGDDEEVEEEHFRYSDEEEEETDEQPVRRSRRARNHRPAAEAKFCTSPAI